MLHEFISSYREAIITRAREKLTDRPWPLVSTSELEFGIPLFLTQLTETLQRPTTSTAPAQDAIGASATKHGSELRALGFNVSQVVHDYGDICQAITEVAVEQNIPISTEEFHILNLCLDTAIAEAVTEHSRITAHSRSSEETERSGQLAHEIRDILHTALLAFHALRNGTVAIGGSTGTMLGRSLTSLRDLVDTSLTDIRMTANLQKRQRIPLATLLSEVALVGHLHAEYRALRLTVDPVDSGLVVDVDPQLLTSAVMNLLNNAFKFTPAGGSVTLRSVRVEQQVRIEVEDECGGFAPTSEDPFKPFGDRRNSDRTGLGLGLSIARRAVRKQGGDIHVRNLPGKGCVFVIEVPLVTDATETLMPDEATAG